LAPARELPALGRGMMALLLVLISLAGGLVVRSGMSASSRLRKR
jgi:hypothetical protein